MEFGQTKSIASFAEKRTRKQSGYKKISNETRQKLIEMVIIKINFRFISKTFSLKMQQLFWTLIIQQQKQY